MDIFMNDRGSAVGTGEDAHSSCLRGNVYTDSASQKAVVTVAQHLNPNGERKAEDASRVSLSLHS